MATNSRDTEQRGKRTPSKEWLLELFESSYIADVTVTTEFADIKAHGAVLSSKSVWFKSEMDTDTQPVLEIDVGSETAVEPLRAALRFCYTGEYRNLQESSDKLKVSDLLFHAIVHGWNELFEIDGLSERSAEKFTTASRMYCSKSEDDEVVAMIQRVLDAREVFGEKAQGLCRKVVVDEFKHMINTLQTAEKFEESIKRMNEIPEAASYLFNPPDPAVATRQSNARQWECEGCSTVFSYETENESRDLDLPLCPCCTQQTSWELRRVRKNNTPRRCRATKRKVVSSAPSTE
ncbi:hypothetical protein K491DRAFT_711495 [Lophiostoma macrostomum CBS 122681]|uniref:BTB domain-containing protein n=1 Tax=Lophiostoma macrostomum CBS 122681 TaxID=1314788 RepID=A0A6A6TNW2_9PLEO|nr:hypothetical protein K491DRAFT_711495 [Lophiostoma macrostomum CBS 122681]